MNPLSNNREKIQNDNTSYVKRDTIPLQVKSATNVKSYYKSKTDETLLERREREKKMTLDAYPLNTRLVKRWGRDPFSDGLDKWVENGNLDEGRQIAKTRILECIKGDKILNLEGLNLKDLPEAVFYLKHLEELKLSGNRLTALNPEIKNLTGIRKLFLDGNRIHILPAGIAQLQGLQEISMRNIPNIEDVSKLLPLFKAGLSFYISDAGFSAVEIVELCRREVLSPVSDQEYRVLNLTELTNFLQARMKVISKLFEGE